MRFVILRRENNIMSCAKGRVRKQRAGRAWSGGTNGDASFQNATTRTFHRVFNATATPLRLAAPILLMVILYVVSSIPGTPLPDDRSLYGVFRWIPPSLQNVLHVPAYAVLSWAWFWSLREWSGGLTLKALLSLSLAASYAFTALRKSGFRSSVASNCRMPTCHSHTANRK